MKSKIVGEITFADLYKDQQDFLIADREEADFGDEEKGVPVYQRTGNDLFLVADFLLGKVTKNFARSAAGIGLYRLGAGIVIETQHGYAAARDERFDWDKPIPVGIGCGLAEGRNPALTAEREAKEEAFVTNLVSGKKDARVRYIPQGNLGYLQADMSSTALGLTANSFEEYGKLALHQTVFNDKQSAYEEWLLWDLSGLSNFTILLQEESFAKGNPCVPVLTRKNGKRTGFFSGQQGWASIEANPEKQHDAWKAIEGVFDSNDNMS